MFSKPEFSESAREAASKCRPFESGQAGLLLPRSGEKVGEEQRKETLFWACEPFHWLTPLSFSHTLDSRGLKLLSVTLEDRIRTYHVPAILLVMIANVAIIASNVRHQIRRDAMQASTLTA